MPIFICVMEYMETIFVLGNVHEFVTTGGRTISLNLKTSKHITHDFLSSLTIETSFVQYFPRSGTGFAGFAVAAVEVDHTRVNHTVISVDDQGNSAWCS